MSRGTDRIQDPSDLYAKGTDLAQGTRKEYKLLFGVTRAELEEIVTEMQAIRVGLEVDVVFNFFGAVVICTQFEE